MKKCLFCILGILVGVVMAVAAPSTRTDGSMVFVNGVATLKIRTGAGGLSANQRATLLAGLIATVNDALPVDVRPTEFDCGIFVGQTKVLTVTRLDARSYSTSVQDLANAWANKLGSALALPPIKASVNTITLPLGGTKRISLVGSKADTAAIVTNGDSICRATRVSEGIEVKAVTVGSGTISLEAAGVSEMISVTVQPYAANFPQNITAEVVGLPADSDTVAGAIETAMRQQLRGAPTAKMSFDVPKVEMLPSGEARSFRIRVRASAPDAFDSTGIAQVVVRNVNNPRKPEDELWYSNNPENVKAAIPLFSAQLTQSRSVRLLYHHINSSSYPMYLRVQAINLSDEPARLVVMPGDSRPVRNPVLAGLVAADQYLRGWISGSGEVVQIPPHCSMPISLRRMAQGETASGLCGLRLLSGPSSILVRSDSWPPFDLEAKWAAAIASSTPWREVGCPPVNDFDRAPYKFSAHIYPNPQKTEEFKYQVGGRYGFVRIGQKAILRQDESSQLDGNFGVVYNVRGSVQNSTANPTDIEIVFEASAGYTGGLFVVGGALVRAEPLQPKEESRVMKFRVEPGQTRQISFFTIPLSGSSYPATITVRPLMTASTQLARVGGK